MNHHEQQPLKTTPQEPAYTIKTFMPLIVIFSIITLVSLAMQYLSPSATLRVFMNNFMGLFFVVFGSFKIFNLYTFAEAYATYDLLAQRSRLYALAYPFIELSLGLLYLLHGYPQTTLVVTVVLMSVNTVGVMRALLKREQFVCACLGAIFNIPMTYVTLLEDVAMLVMAIFMLVS